MVLRFFLKQVLQENNKSKKSGSDGTLL